MLAEEGGRGFETEKTMDRDLEVVGVVPRRDQ